jgi:hypothetical protein
VFREPREVQQIPRIEILEKGGNLIAVEEIQAVPDDIPLRAMIRPRSDRVHLEATVLQSPQGVTSDEPGSARDDDFLQSANLIL